MMYKIKIYVFVVIYAASIANLFGQKITPEQFDQIQLRTHKSVDNTTIIHKSFLDYSESRYNSMKPLIIDKDIPTIQKAIKANLFSYKELVQFYIYRIRMFDTTSDSSLHSIISLNPNILKEAIEKDAQLKNNTIKDELFGMPILIKDNIGTINMPTTAGAIALSKNYTDDAFIVKNLKSRGALILGKANMTEWANYICFECPSGYSAIGGHTLNPYKPREFDTGGSSSGSGVAVAANLAVAAIGTETSGSILSPASQNSVVGLKPSVGLLSRSGIVPLASTFDTPGPITKNIIDNAILISALVGFDQTDLASVKQVSPINYTQNLDTSTLKGKRFGMMSEYLNLPPYQAAIEEIKKNGGEVVEIKLDFDWLNIEEFMSILKFDFKNDLASYLKNTASKDVEIKSMSDLVSYNNKDKAIRIPYGQKHLEDAIKDTTKAEQIKLYKETMRQKGSKAFDDVFDLNKLDAILSVNANSALYVVLANYSALTVPIGYTQEGEPMGITFIARPFEEKKLLELGAAFEKIKTYQTAPKGYK